MTALILRTAALPAPVHFLVGDEAAAQRAAVHLGWPLVVKPADRERSEGVTVSVKDTEKLLVAFRLAARLSQRVLVEREVPGICYRLMVANGRFLYAVRRLPKAVFGDGCQSVAALIDKAAAEAMKLPSWKRGKAITLDEQCREALAVQGKAPDSIPEAGERVALRMIESEEWGGDVQDATDLVHPDNAEVAVRVAGVLRLTNAGVDIITPDISRPWYENGAIINEVNFALHFGVTTAARDRMPLFIRDLVGGDGRIPVEVFLGGDAAFWAARERQAALAAAGIADSSPGMPRPAIRPAPCLPWLQKAFSSGSVRS